MQRTVQLRPTPLIKCSLKMAEIIYCNNRRILSGNPYITHPLAVGKTLQRLRFSETDVAAGLLHDGPEDHPDLSFDGLMNMYAAGGIGREQAEPVIDRVRAVTFDHACVSKHDQQERYRVNLVANPKAIPLALADADDNMGEIVMYLHTFRVNVFGRNYLNCDPRKELGNWLAIAALGFDRAGSDRRIKMLSHAVAKRAELIRKLLHL